MKAFLNIALYRLKSFYRDTFTFFFSLILPIIFVIIFGFVFGGEKGENGENVVKIGVLKSQEDVVRVVEKIRDIQISKVDGRDKMRDLVVKGSLDGGIILEGDTFNLIINFSSFQQKPFLRTLGDTISTLYSLKESGFEEEFIKVEEEFIDPGKAKVSTLGYLIPGVLSFSISSSIFSMIALFGYYRKRKILKRFAVTPVNSFSFVSGMVIGNFLVSLIASTFVFIFSQIIFNISFSINYLLYFISISSSILGMMALGIFLSAVFKEPETANNAGNLLVNVMLFFSGVYFPLDFLPDYLKTFAHFLPLYYIGRALRISVGVEEGPSEFIFLFSFIMISVFLILVSVFGRNILELEEKISS